MEFNSDFKYDLLVGQVSEDRLAEILKYCKVEVKSDKIAQRTGNVFVEYSDRNKPSGISISESDYYCFEINGTYHLIETSILKEKCRKYFNTRNDVKGGDNNLAKGILLPIIELF
jgi:hypothetical protein